MLSVLPGVAFPIGQRHALPQDAGNAPIEKHCPRVIFVTCTSRWTEDTYRGVPKFTVSAGCTKKLGPRTKETMSLGEGPCWHSGVSLLSCRTASCSATLLCFCVVFLPALMDLQWAWLQSPQSHAGQSHQGQVLEKRPSLAWCLAQSGCLMNIY